MSYTLPLTKYFVFLYKMEKLWNRFLELKQVNDNELHSPAASDGLCPAKWELFTLTMEPEGYWYLNSKIDSGKEVWLRLLLVGFQCLFFYSSDGISLK